MDYSRFLNRTSSAREASPLRLLTELLTRSGPSTIFLAGGNPSPSNFPIISAQLTLRDGSTLTIDEDRMRKALSYGTTQGVPGLVDFTKSMLQKVHNPPKQNCAAEEGRWDLCITNGALDAISRSFEMLLSEGDNIITDTPTYAEALSMLRPLGVNILSVETDGDGMKPECLRQRLSKWNPSDALNPKSDIPKVLYTIPNGVNPTGASLTLDRKKEIYKIAQEYNLIILEDDPYYFLQFGEREPTFLSLDVDGRVLRYDSYSKILAPGLRVGVVSGPHPLVEHIKLHMMSSVMHIPNIAQEVVYQLVHKWGIEGFFAHVNSVKDYYKNQKDVMMAAAKKYLKDFAEWNEPKAGLFFWIKLKYITDTKDLIEQKAAQRQVIFCPGCIFLPDRSTPSPYVRASFSLATPEQIYTGFQRLAQVIKDEISSMK